MKNSPNPISSPEPSSSSDSSFFFSSFLAAGAASTTAAAAAGPAAPTPDPMFVIKSLTLTPSKALAKSPGQ